jgi:cytochrome c553
LLGGLLLVAGWSGLSYAGHFPAENVSATKHNLSANTNIGFGSATAGSSEVCVYCHTPHGAGYGALVGVGVPPLWNRLLNTPTSYQTYNDAQSPHFEATSVATLGGAIKGVSLACLSCHDGTIAFDALINLQGSGGYQPANATQGAGPGDTTISAALFGAFSAEGSTVIGRTFNDTPRGADGVGDPFGGSVYTNDTLTGPGTVPFPNLFTDLRDDHPISFQIPCGDPTDDTCDPQFAELEQGVVADNNAKILYLKRDLGAGFPGRYPQDKRDRLRAYTSANVLDTVTTGSVANAYIECASCHNPHTPRTVFLRLPSNVNATGGFEATVGLGLPSGADVQTATGVVGGIFWSHAPNQASAICVSCHQK